MPDSQDVAVVIPCHNEELTVAKVIAGFRNSLPGARIYVYDNCSTDRTAIAACDAGAIVRFEALRGKGNVIRRMFSDIEADIYVLVDGDDTYDARRAPDLVRLLTEQNLDMVNAARSFDNEKAFRSGHRAGNRVLSKIVQLIFGSQIQDLFSGYRAFSRRFVKSFPALSTGFEVETELTIHALELRMPVAEVSTAYKERPEHSTSKLNTIHDGFRILKTIAVLVKEERPLPFFLTLFMSAVLSSLTLAWPIFLEYLNTGLVPRFPTAILATGVMLLGFIFLACGLILDTVTHGRREMRRLHYLSYAAPQKDLDGSSSSPQ